MNENSKKINQLEEMFSLVQAALAEAIAERDQLYPLFSSLEKHRQNQQTMIFKKIDLEWTLIQLEQQSFKEPNSTTYDSILASMKKIRNKLEEIEEQELNREQEISKDELKIKELLKTDSSLKKLQDYIDTLKKQREKLFEEMQVLRKEGSRKTDIKKIAYLENSNRFFWESYEKVTYTPHALELSPTTTMPAPLQAIENVLGKVADFSGWFPPLRVAAIGMLSLFELYRLIQSKESTIKKTTRIVLTLGAVALAIAALLVPVATAVILVATILGIGIIKEGMDYFSARHHLKAVQYDLDSKKQLLREWEEKEKTLLKKTFTDISYESRINYLKRDIDIHEKYLKKVKDITVQKRNDSILGAITIVGAVLAIFPPTTLIGVGIFLSAVAVSVGVKLYRTGVFGKMWNGMKSIAVKIFKPSVVTEKIKKEDTLLQHGLKEKESEGDAKKLVGGQIAKAFAKQTHPGASNEELFRDRKEFIDKTIVGLHYHSSKIPQQSKPIKTRVSENIKPKPIPSSGKLLSKKSEKDDDDGDARDVIQSPHK